MSIDVLDQPCSNEHLLPISKKLVNWSSYCNHLQLTDLDTHAISTDLLLSDSCSAPHAKGLKMLKAWQRKCAYTTEAHYRHLLRGCLLIHENAKLVGEICELINTV